ncbi:MAG: fructose-bisphosphatase class II family protein, partial [Clostridiales Family XIII bacterium]|nr:fructose-bisphosphatase class II family protein [Clostridiales Family XIII bacterium]
MAKSKPAAKTSVEAKSKPESKNEAKAAPKKTVKEPVALPALETLTRVTEFAAIEASRTVGKRAKYVTDKIAVRAQGIIIDEAVEGKGLIVQTEGGLDEADMFDLGSFVGKHKDRRGPQDFDIAIDPIEGTSLCAFGRPGAIAVMAVAEPNAFLVSKECYMWKLVVGPQAKGAIDLKKSATENIKAVAEALGKKPSDMVIALLERKRHSKLIEEISDLGVHIMSLDAGDLMPGIATCIPDSGVDMLLGAGGGPEGVITAAAVKCLGGDMQGKLDVGLTELEMGREMKEEFAGIDERIMKLDQIVNGKVHAVIATAVTDTYWLRGVQYNSKSGYVTTDSMILHSSNSIKLNVRTIRNLKTHNWRKL